MIKNLHKAFLSLSVFSLFGFLTLIVLHILSENSLLPFALNDVSYVVKCLLFTAFMGGAGSLFFALIRVLFIKD